MINTLKFDKYDEAIKSSEKVIVEFSADWCGPCKIMKPILERVSEKGIAVFDVDVDEEIDLATKFSIRNIPTTFYYKNGELIAKSVGVQMEDKILEKFEQGAPDVVPKN